jgi:glycosyltransferase involved in cell wall biosynthesis
MRYVLFLLLLLPLCELTAFKVRKNDVEIVVVIPSYNNKRFLRRNLHSLIRQTYPKWEMIYLNDCSTDKTGDRVERFIKKYRIAKRSKVIHNNERVGAMANIYNAVSQTAPHKVIVLMDGDDKFKNRRVLARVAKTYRNKKVWISYGNYQASPQKGWTNDPCHAFPKQVMRKRAFRNYTWVCYPLRTFRAKLFHLIKKEDLMWKDKFFPVVSDTGYMFPMLEMASRGHIHFEKKVQYIYHVNSPINDFRLRLPLMDEVSAYIRGLPRYKALKKL